MAKSKHLSPINLMTRVCWVVTMRNLRGGFSLSEECTATVFWGGGGGGGGYREGERPNRPRGYAGTVTKRCAYRQGEVKVVIHSGREESGYASRLTGGHSWLSE